MSRFYDDFYLGVPEILENSRQKPRASFLDRYGPYVMARQPAKVWLDSASIAVPKLQPIGRDRLPKALPDRAKSSKPLGTTTTYDEAETSKVIPIPTVPERAPSSASLAKKSQPTSLPPSLSAPSRATLKRRHSGHLPAIKTTAVPPVHQGVVETGSEEALPLFTPRYGSHKRKRPEPTSCIRSVNDVRSR